MAVGRLVRQVADKGQVRSCSSVNSSAAAVTLLACSCFAAFLRHLHSLLRAWTTMTRPQHCGL